MSPDEPGVPGECTHTDDDNAGRCAECIWQRCKAADHEATMAKVEAIGHAHSEGHLSAMVDELVAAIKAVEWSGHRGWGGPCCPWCDGFKPGVEFGLPLSSPRYGHRYECTLLKLGTIPIEGRDAIEASQRQSVEGKSK